jgi:hypothetical protein
VPGTNFTTPDRGAPLIPIQSSSNMDEALGRAHFRGKPRAALRAIGLERFAPPLLIAGRVDLDGADLSAVSPLYLGIAPNEADRIRFREPPNYG